MEKTTTPYANPNPDFAGLMSSDEIWYAGETDICLTDVINEKVDINHTHSGYASTNHTHNGYASANHTHSDYASANDLALLEGVVDTKANADHSHSEYAPETHYHFEYAEQIALDALNEELNEKADIEHTHENYALCDHEHEGYSLVSHNHNENYAGIAHVHNEYATTSALNELSSVVSSKADASHAHDNIYYTETEIDTKLATKAESSHNHTGVYDVSGAAASALSSAQAYTDSKIDALVGEGASATLDTIGEISSAIEDNQDAIDLLNAAIGNKANSSDLTSHVNNTEIHITDTERNNWNAKSNFSGNYNDLTNKPSIPSINGLATEDYVNEKVDGITVESIGAMPNTAVIPTVPTNISAFANDVGYLTEHQSLNGYATEAYVDMQINAIVIPDSLSDLTTDSTHRTVTDAEKAAWNAKSNFSGNYNDLINKPTIPSIAGLATEIYVDEAVSAKADAGHNHNNVYYTETEIDSLLADKANSSHTHTIANVSGLQNALNGKSDSTHNHNSSYDALGAADTALASANEYTDEAIADEVTARNAAIATAKSSAISTASSDATTKANNALDSAKLYTDTAVDTVKNDLLNGAGSAYDTLKELGDLIDDNVDAIEALEAVAAGKANASHTHAISNITNLQSALDGKAATSHGTHVSYSTTAPVMDGTASVGTATTVARSDHKHPTDTSRAAQTSLDSHTGNKSNPHSVTLAQLGLTATAAEINTLGGITATVTELNYVDGVTSNIQTQLNGKASSSHNHSGVYASASHTHTASAVGAVASGDVATLTEVKTYLGI